MRHEALQENIGAYALGALDPHEEAELRRHLRDCEECSRLLASDLQVRDALNVAVPQAELPSGFTSRLLSKASSPTPLPVERSRAGWASRWPLALAAASVLVALGLGIRVWQLENELAEQRNYDATVAALIADPQVQALNLESTAPDASGRLYLRPDGKAAMLVVKQLPPLPEGKVYQLWLSAPGKRESGGTFRPNYKGTQWLYLHPTEGLSAYRSIGVTVEPEGGSPDPTGPRVIGTEL